MAANLIKQERLSTPQTGVNNLNQAMNKTATDIDMCQNNAEELRGLKKEEVVNSPLIKDQHPHQPDEHVVLKKFTQLWFACHFDKKLTRQKVNEADIKEIVSELIAYFCDAQQRQHCDFKRATPLLTGLHNLFVKRLAFLQRDCDTVLREMNDPIVKVEQEMHNNRQQPLSRRKPKSNENFKMNPLSFDWFLDGIDKGKLDALQTKLEQTVIRGEELNNNSDAYKMLDKQLEIDQQLEQLHLNDDEQQMGSELRQMQPDGNDFEQMLDAQDIDMQSLQALQELPQQPMKLDEIPFAGFDLEFSSQIEMIQDGNPRQKKQIMTANAKQLKELKFQIQGRDKCITIEDNQRKNQKQHQNRHHFDVEKDLFQMQDFDTNESIGHHVVRIEKIADIRGKKLPSLESLMIDMDVDDIKQNKSMFQFDEEEAEEEQQQHESEIQPEEADDEELEIKDQPHKKSVTNIDEIEKRVRQQIPSNQCKLSAHILSQTNTANQKLQATKLFLDCLHLAQAQRLTMSQDVNEDVQINLL